MRQRIFIYFSGENVMIRNEPNEAEAEDIVRKDKNYERHHVCVTLI